MLWLPKWLATETDPLKLSALPHVDEYQDADYLAIPRKRPSRRTFLFLGASAAVGALVAPTLPEIVHLQPRFLGLLSIDGVSLAMGRRGGKTWALVRALEMESLVQEHRTVLDRYRLERLAGLREKWTGRQLPPPQALLRSPVFAESPASLKE